MRILFNIILIAGFGFMAYKFFPIWWIVSVVSFIISFAFGSTAFKSFIAGFFGVFFFWTFLTLINTIENDFVLIDKMGELFKLPFSTLLILITAFIGGLLGGLGSLTGYFLKTFSTKE